MFSISVFQQFPANELNEAKYMTQCGNTLYKPATLISNPHRLHI